MAPLAFAVVLWRGLRDRSYWDALGERFGFGPAHADAEPAVWLHAVSLGEMSAAASLIHDLRARHPHIPVIVTSATPAGRARALALWGKSVDVRFLPYDTPGSVRRFLERVRPRLAIIMETELWPNLFAECRVRQVPVFLANARISANSVARYRRFGSLFSGVFTDTVLIAAQSADDAARFLALGAVAQMIHPVGNLKFDLQVDVDAVADGKRLRAAFGAARPLWIAGSTHAREEEQVLDAHALVRAGQPDALLLLVPRHKDRFGQVAELLARRGIPFERRSEAAAVRAGTQVLLADTVGELISLYAAADVAFVGGSLVPIGGHNLLEPAALGLPVFTGPSHFNSASIAQLLLTQGAAVQVGDAAELARGVSSWLADPAERARIGTIGREIVVTHRGSVARLLELMEPALRMHRPSAAH